MPSSEGLGGGDMAQGALRDVAVVEFGIAAQGGGEILRGIEAGGVQHVCMRQKDGYFLPVLQ